MERQNVREKGKETENIHNNIIYIYIYTVAPKQQTCQRNIHMDGRNKGFPAEDWPKHHSASAGSRDSHSASWCHVSPRKPTHMHPLIFTSPVSAHNATPDQCISGAESADTYNSIK